MSTEEKQDQNVDNTEEVKKGEDVQSTAESKNTEQEHMIPKSRFDEVNQKYQDEAKRRAALEKQIEENQKKRLKEQEDYKALYEQTEGELAELKPKAERLIAYEATLKETLEAAIAEIPEGRRTLIPSEYSVDQQLKWISQNRALLSKLSPVDQGAGVRGGGESKSVELTPEERQIAADYGMTAEEYAKYKDKS